MEIPPGGTGDLSHRRRVAQLGCGAHFCFFRGKASRSSELVSVTEGGCSTCGGAGGGATTFGASGGRFAATLGRADGVGASDTIASGGSSPSCSSRKLFTSVS